MTNKFTKQATQKFKICRNKKKIDSFKIEQDIIYQNQSTRSRLNLNKKQEQNINEE